MKKASFKKSYSGFEKKLDWYGDFLSKKLQVLPKNKNPILEDQEILEAFVFKIAAKWDVLVSQIFISSLNRDSTKYSKTLGLKLRRHLTKDESEAILMGSRYIDIKSVGHAKNFAKKHLVDKHNPLKLITSVDTKKIYQFFVIRNYLAHYSSYAKRKYEAMITKEYSLKRVTEPGIFLYKLNNKTKKYRWLEFIEAFLNALKSMKKIS